MNESTEPTTSRSMKGDSSLLMRSLQWLAVMLAFALGQVLTAKYDPNVGAAYALLAGLPLAYVFCKAVVYRLYGIPLTWRELSVTTLRAAATTATTFALLAAVLIVACASLYLLVIAICSSAFGMGL